MFMSAHTHAHTHIHTYTLCSVAMRHTVIKHPVAHFSLETYRGGLSTGLGENQEGGKGATVAVTLN